MNTIGISFIVRCHYDATTGNTQLQVVRVDTGQEICLSDATFLLRIMPNKQATVKRCYIRHISSGREAYIQGGPKLVSFIRTCLLPSEETDAQ